MSGPRPRLVIICVDGGLPDLIRRHDFFNLTRVLPGLTDTGVRTMRSVFPSSTAPAHASFLTGRTPAGHGIVGNRFWETQSVAEIRTRADDPLSAFHPYERGSLTAPDLLDRFAEHGASAVAVHFPHTFARRDGTPDVPSCYCLYAPARDLTVPLTDRASGTRTGTRPVTYLGHPVHLTTTLDPSGDLVHVTLAGAAPRALRPAHPVRLDAPTAVGEVSVAATLLDTDPAAVTLRLGTAVIVRAHGGLTVTAEPPGSGPASLHPTYTAGPGHRFHEAPRTAWIEHTALTALRTHDPDVLLVRFNQADHAQEFLYWHAERGFGTERRHAWQQILDVYAEIDAAAARLAQEAGPGAEIVFFSDHGIDYVETHLRPNRLLADAGALDRMVFQGDSNCAYLYADAPLAADEEQRLIRGLRALDPTVSVLGRDERGRLGLPTDSPRTGRLTISCGPHIEFQYGQDAAREHVASASHGYLPTAPTMSGFLRRFGRTVRPQEEAPDITVAAALIRATWRRMTEGTHPG
ncbi:alkaline phosphatase family protein [Streptomyces sp. NPDC091377]|uniref:alkaline phosphatase family protein n=1 Tax=Streptomyces sp. NPDC091377 TaxID=3365995 RepID=UPI00380393C6